jgi:hypothetical protein
MNRRAVLSCWQEAWEPLSEPQRGRFLSRPEVGELTSMSDETVRMAIRAHPKLHWAMSHARWLRDGRRPGAACGCTAEEARALDFDTEVHKLSVLPGPDTRVGGRSLTSATVVARCSCDWERRAASEALLRTIWLWHVMGDEEEPLLD